MEGGGGSECTVQELRSVIAHGVSACDVVFPLFFAGFLRAQLCGARMGTAGPRRRRIRGAICLD